jgi:hypothetical protein
MLGISEGKYALGALTLLAIWVLACLPWFYSSDWGLSDKIAVVASGAALLQFLALIATIYVMMESSKRQLRAYISSDVAGIHLSPDKETIQFSFVSENHGQTPARNVRHFIQQDICDHPMPSDFTFPPIVDEFVTSSPVIFPGHKPSAVGREVYLSRTQLDEIFGEKRRLYVRSVTRYDDVFSQHQETSFCIYLGGLEFKAMFIRVVGKAISGGAAGEPAAFDISHRYNDAT